MNDQAIFFFGIDNINDLAVRENQLALIPYLSATFRVKRGFVQHYLELRLAFRSYLAVFGDMGDCFGFIIPGKLNGIIILYDDPVAGINRGGSGGSGFFGLGEVLGTLQYQHRSRFHKPLTKSNQSESHMCHITQKL